MVAIRVRPDDTGIIQVVQVQPVAKIVVLADGRQHYRSYSMLTASNVAKASGRPQVVKSLIQPARIAISEGMAVKQALEQQLHALRVIMGATVAAQDSSLTRNVLHVHEVDTEKL